MKVPEAIIHRLKAHGTDTIFGLMSEDTMALLSILDKEWSNVIRMIPSRHEQGAVAMADGYSRANGQTGVCLIGRGPAIAQTGTALVTARKNGSNMLVIVPEPKLSSSYDIKSFAQERYLESTVGSIITSRSSQTVIEDLDEAFRQIRNGMGPVALQINWDVLDGKVSAEPTDVNSKPTLTSLPTPRDPDLSAVKTAVDLYLDSDATVPPVILAGKGAVNSDARTAIESLAERMNALLTTTLRARGYFDNHPYSLGFVGNYGYDLANEYIANANFVLAIGCGLNPHTTDQGYLFNDDTTIVQIDDDPTAVGRFTSVNHGIIGDAKLTVQSLLSELESINIDRDGAFWTDSLRERITEYSPLEAEEYPDSEGKIDPRALVDELDEVLPPDRRVICDVGQVACWVLDGITTQDPEDFIWPAEFASIGLSLPTGIGASMSADERPCVTFCGDAGFLMSLQELETAAREDVPIIVIILNDAALGAEYHSMVASGTPAEHALLGSPDMESVAEGLGAEAHTVRSLDGLTALNQTIQETRDRPLVLDCKVDRNVSHRSRTGH